MVSEEVEGDEILEGADLCVACLFPVRPGSDLCAKCGAPHGELAAILPFLRILSEGYVYRQAVQHPRSWITVAGVWLLLGIQVAGGLLLLPVLLGSLELTGWNLLGVLAPLVGVVVYALIGVAGIVQSTRNFRRGHGDGVKRTPG